MCLPGFETHEPCRRAVQQTGCAATGAPHPERYSLGVPEQLAAPMTIHLVGSHLRPSAVARRTRDAVSSGQPVAWIANRDTDLRRSLAALGEWRAPSGGGPWHLGDTRRLVYFAPDDSPREALTYFVKPKRQAVEHVLACSSCGLADPGWVWSEPSEAPLTWLCSACVSESGQTREVQRRYRDDLTTSTR